MSKSKTKEVYVKRRMKGYAYADGRVHEMPADQAKLFLDEGFGLEKEPKAEEAEQEYDLPEDIPYRKFLIEAGFKRLDHLKTHKSLATIKHFNEKRAEKLQKYLDKH